MLGPQRAFPSSATSSPIFSLAGSLSPAAPLGLLPKSRLPQGLPSPAMLVPVGLRHSWIHPLSSSSGKYFGGKMTIRPWANDWPLPPWGLGVHPFLSLGPKKGAASVRGWPSGHRRPLRATEERSNFPPCPSAPRSAGEGRAGRVANEDGEACNGQSSCSSAGPLFLGFFLGVWGGGSEFFSRKWWERACGQFGGIHISLAFIWSS